MATEKRIRQEKTPGRTVLEDFEGSMNPGNPIYLDYNASTPLAPEVAEFMRSLLDGGDFGNPSSSHVFGVRSKRIVEQSRQQVAALLGCKPDEIIFTSGGSESNNTSILGVARARRHAGRHLITSVVEHPAVTEVCRYLETRGWRVTYLPVDQTGLVSLYDAKAAMSEDTVLITVMHANNEVGTIEPVAELAALAKSRGVIMHTDAAQSVGKIPVRVDELGVDLLSLAGHKLYGPKGIGVLYCRRGVVFEKLVHGAGHEDNRRAGTENVMHIAGLGLACEIAARDLDQVAHHTRRLRDRLFQGLQKRVPEVRRNGHSTRCLPNTLSVAFPHIDADALLSRVSAEVAASSGSACHAERLEISAVLRAMKIPEALAMGTVRLSTGRMSTETEIDRAVEVLAQAAESLRQGRE